MGLILIISILNYISTFLLSFIKNITCKIKNLDYFCTRFKSEVHLGFGGFTFLWYLFLIWKDERIGLGKIKFKNSEKSFGRVEKVITFAAP
jgi:hypothetical protein